MFNIFPNGFNKGAEYFSKGLRGQPSQLQRAFEKMHGILLIKPPKAGQV